MEVTGPVDFKLYAASSAVDTDWTATLSDLHPDGQAIHVCEGIRGARFRDSLETPMLIEPGKVYEYDQYPSHLVLPVIPAGSGD